MEPDFQDTIRQALQTILGDDIEVHVGTVRVEPDGEPCRICGEVHKEDDTIEDRQRHAVKGLDFRIEKAKQRLALMEELRTSIATPIDKRKDNQIVKEMVLMNQLENLSD